MEISTEQVVVTGQDLPSYNAEDATTATRLPERILDTDRAVQVITQQVIQDRDIIDPQEAAQNVSDVQRGGSRTGIGEVFFVRGFQQTSLFKDGFRSGEASGGDVFTFEGPTDIANIQRIEVLKGPSAILYGRGEPGGTVNYITRTPVFENYFSLDQQFGSYDFYRTQLNATWSPVPGRLALGLDAAYQNNGSFIDFVGAERYFVAPAFKWQIDENTSLSFRSEYTDDDHSTALSLPYDNGHVIPNIPYNRYMGEPDFTNIDTKTFRGLLTFEHRWNQDNVTTLSLNGVNVDADGGNFILFPFFGPLQDPVTGDITRNAEIIDYSTDYFTARLDHIWNWTIYDGGAETITTSKDAKDRGAFVRRSNFPTVKNQLLFSAEFDHQGIDGQRTLSGQAPLNPYHPVYTGYSPQPLIPGFPVTFLEKSSDFADAFSLLLLDRLSFGETLYLSFGGRYEWFNANTKVNYPQGKVPFPNTNNSLDQSTFNPTAGLLVKPTHNLSVYFNYAESTNSFQNIGLTTANGDALEPERARQFEVGAKAEWLGGKLLTTVALFQIEKSNVAVTDPNNPFFSINGGDQRSRGIEFDTSGEPIPGWRVIANYAYVDARVINDPDGSNTGHRLPSVPENSGGMFTTYEIRTGLLRGLGFGGGVYLSGPVEFDIENSGNLAGWAQTDAVVYYQRNRFRAQLNVKNLFDNQFYFPNSFSGFEVQRAAARTFIGSIKYAF
ncbi:MAG TPA: TonB-dependent receptor [Candidatus Udaeobacter sp.]|nr:TonB-dependent receptor [Candidatus Udaeobacter sp.]